jgi:hypothetical protein
MQRMHRRRTEVRVWLYFSSTNAPSDSRWLTSRLCLFLTKLRFKQIYTNDGSKFAGSTFNLSYFLKVIYIRLWKGGINCYITSIHEFHVLLAVHACIILWIEPTWCTNFLNVYCFSLHFSGNCVPIIRRKLPYLCDTWYLLLY